MRRGVVGIHVITRSLIRSSSGVLETTIKSAFGYVTFISPLRPGHRLRLIRRLKLSLSDAKFGCVAALPRTGCSQATLPTAAAWLGQGVCPLRAAVQLRGFDSAWWCDLSGTSALVSHVCNEQPTLHSRRFESFHLYYIYFTYGEAA